MERWCVSHHFALGGVTIAHAAWGMVITSLSCRFERNKQAGNEKFMQDMSILLAVGNRAGLACLGLGHSVPTGALRTTYFRHSALFHRLNGSTV